MLLDKHPRLQIIHVAGRAHAAQLSQLYDNSLSTSLRERVVVKDYLTDSHAYSGAADIVIGRGGATNLAEFAVQSKACIIIPAPQLSWAIKNTEALAARQAIIYLTEAQSQEPGRLSDAVAGLLDNPAQRATLAAKLGELAQDDAAHNLAVLLLENTKKTDTDSHEITT
jgi:UDP-N-acetylglucosamine--N-acetylmuramyl-(pentapeptide) pyrophosphoryl-undecaprenol N-acetylglucosamine transferase